MIRFILLLFSATIGLFAYSMDMNFLREQANKACNLNPGETDGSLNVSGLSVIERIGYAQQLHPPAGKPGRGRPPSCPGPE
jgi:hypothetical protein